MNVDDRRTMLGGSPAAQLAVNNLEDLEPEKDPVIDVGSEHQVQLRLDGELLDFGWAKGGHAAASGPLMTISTVGH